MTLVDSIISVKYYGDFLDVCLGLVPEFHDIQACHEVLKSDYMNKTHTIEHHEKEEGKLFLKFLTLKRYINDSN